MSRVFAYGAPADLHCGYNALGLVVNALGRDPIKGDAFCLRIGAVRVAKFGGAMGQGSPSS